MLMIATGLSLGVLLPTLQTGCARRSPQAAGSPKKVTLAVSPLLGSAALYVANEKGYFNEEGLDATVRTYASGRVSLQAVLAGEADFCAVAETPIAHAAIEGKPLAVVATICEIDRATLIVARKDRGISQADDLWGKKVGVAQGTSADFFLHVYLTASYIDPKEVRITDLPAEEVVDALLAGAVDAVSVWAPQAITSQGRLGANAVVLDEPGLQTMTWNLVVTRDLLGRDPDAVVRVLRAIVRANRFLADQPAEALAITARNLDIDIAAAETKWADCKAMAALDQSLILNLEDQARWILKDQHLDEATPNFLDFIDTRTLKTVAPDAVQLVERQE